MTDGGIGGKGPGGGKGPNMVAEPGNPVPLGEATLEAGLEEVMAGHQNIGEWAQGLNDAAVVAPPGIETGQGGVHKTSWWLLKRLLAQGLLFSQRTLRRVS